MSGIERDEQRHLQKKRAVLGLLLFVAVWPLLHRALVVRFDVNPWKLGGFAMYASATPPLQVVVFHEAARGMKPLEERTLPESMQEQLARFRIERHALGQLRSVDDVGRSILDARPDLRWVVVAVQRMALDPKTARMSSTQTRYVFERDEIAETALPR